MCHAERSEASLIEWSSRQPGKSIGSLHKGFFARAKHAASPALGAGLSEAEGTARAQNDTGKPLPSGE
jgi:hypothetical protein